MGDLTKEQSEMMKAELKTVLERLNERQGPQIEVERTLANAALLFADMTAVKAAYNKKVISITGNFSDEAKAGEMVEAVTKADIEVRKIFEMAGAGIKAQFIDTKKPFVTAESSGKKFTAKFKSGFLNTGFLSFIMMGKVSDGPPR